MSLSITQQRVKGGAEVLMVRDGSIRLLAFPLDMRDLATKMCLEGNELGEVRYPALTTKYAAERARRLKSAEKSLPPPTSVPAVEQPPAKPAPEKSNVPDGATVIAAKPIGMTPLPEIPPGLKFAISGDPPKRDNTLADLLDAARKAEIDLAHVREAYHLVSVELADKQDRAAAAWKAFNQALRASLPEDSAIQGVQAQ